MEHPRLAFFSGPNAAKQASTFFGSLFSPQNSLLQMARDAQLFDSVVTDAGGMTSFSAKMREIKIYEHDVTPYDTSRTYLEDRDTIAWATTTGFAERMWSTFPLLRDRRHQDFLATLQQAQFLRTLRDAEAMARRDGVAYVYIRATGDPAEPLAPGDRIISFSPLGRWQIPDAKIERHRGDDPILVQHGIERVSVEEKGADGKTKSKEVHGHRIYQLVRNRGRGYLWPVYDDLWYMKDLKFSLRMSQYAGNPIAMEVDPKFLETVGEDLSEPEMEALKLQLAGDVAKLQSGHLASFAPVKGIIIKRVGASALDDPLPLIRLLASSISLATGLSTNRVAASSRGSEQVTGEDRTDEMTWVYERQLMDAVPLYSFLLDLAKLTKTVPVRTPLLPVEMKWPYTRILNPREMAYVTGKDASTISTLANIGRDPPPELEERYPMRTRHYDPEALPPKLAPIDPSTGKVPEKSESTGTFSEEEPAAAARVLNPDIVLSYSQEMKAEGLGPEEDEVVEEEDDSDDE